MIVYALTEDSLWPPILVSASHPLRANHGGRDKASLSSGVVFGLKKDTHLVGQDYGLLSVWFCGCTSLGRATLILGRPRVCLCANAHELADAATSYRQDPRYQRYHLGWAGYGSWRVQ